MIKNPTLVPPGGFGYMQPETGVTRDGQSFSGTVALVQEHRVSNNLDRQDVDDVIADVELQICQRAPGDYCYGNLSVVQQGVTRERILGGVKAIAAWLGAALHHETVFVDQAEADRRAGICARCFLNKDGQGCTGCSFGDSLREAIGLTIGERSTARDPALQTCRVCGCLNRVQIWFKIEIMDGLMDAETKARFASIPHCWKGKS